MQATDPADEIYGAPRGGVLTSCTTAGNGPVTTSTRALQVWRPTDEPGSYSLGHMSEAIHVSFSGTRVFLLPEPVKVLGGDHLGFHNDGRARNCVRNDPAVHPGDLRDTRGG